MKTLIVALLFLAGMMTNASASTAANWPDKPVRFIVPTGAGGGIDLAARAVARQLEKTWKAGVIVENRPGGNAMIATNHVMESPADGHTILFYSHAAFGSSAGMSDKPFEWDQHFVALGFLYTPPFVLVVNSKKNIQNLVDLANYGQSKGLAYGSTVGGSPLHLYGALTTDIIKSNGIVTPYKAVPQIVVDILNGQLDFAVLNVSTVSPHIKAGTMTPLMVFDTKNPPGIAANVPNLNAPGFTAFKTLVYTYTWFVKKDTPQSVQLAIQRDIDQAVKDVLPDLLEKNLATGFQESNAHSEAVRSSVIFRRLSRELAK